MSLWHGPAAACRARERAGCGTPSASRAPRRTHRSARRHGGMSRSLACEPAGNTRQAEDRPRGRTDRIVARRARPRRRSTNGAYEGRNGASTLAPRRKRGRGPPRGPANPFPRDHGGSSGARADESGIVPRRFSPKGRCRRPRRPEAGRARARAGRRGNRRSWSQGARGRESALSSGPSG